MGCCPYCLLKIVILEVVSEFGFGYPGEILEPFCGKFGNSKCGNSPESKHSCFIIESFSGTMSYSHGFSCWKMHNWEWSTLKKVKTHVLENSFVGISLSD